MTEDKRDEFKRLLAVSPPPELSRSEWDGIYRSIIQSLAGEQEKRSRRRIPALVWGFSAIFMLGVGLGILLAPERTIVVPSNIPGQQPEVLKHETPVPAENQPSPMLASAEKSGVEIFGLKNVQVEPRTPEVMGGRLYQLSGETQRGVQVVWTYLSKNQTVSQ